VEKKWLDSTPTVKTKSGLGAAILPLPAGRKGGNKEPGDGEPGSSHTRPHKKESKRGGKKRAPQEFLNEGEVPNPGS